METRSNSQSSVVPEVLTRHVESKTVYARELDEIIRRRQAAHLPDASREETQRTLVGLALSGGGLRSAAMSLGVLQALYMRGVLPLIDYLSTVSGGGYAGAWLTSISLQAHRLGVAERAGESNRSADSNSAIGGEGDDSFPIAPLENGRQPPRILKFIHGGRYLQRTWVFFNRYVIGLILIWIVVFSGLIAASSSITWMFRWLDHQRSRDWLGALTFDGDVKLALFPSFVLFLIWFLFWAISYFKYGAQATGRIARCLFVALAIVTLVAVAALVGTGELDDIGKVLRNLGLNLEQETIKRLETVISTLIFSAIGASLIPYLSPKRLLQSGTSGSKPLERITFWIATRALVIGVPFVFIAFFARENISQWNNRRDDRITFVEIDWSPSSPLWQPLFEDRADPSGMLWAWMRWPLFENLFEDRPRSTRIGNIWQTSDQQELAEQFEIMARCSRQIAAYELDVNVNEYQANVQAVGEASGDNPGDFAQTWWLKDSELSFRQRWWYLVQAFAVPLFGGDINDNPVYQIQANKRDGRKSRQEVVEILYRRMKDPGLYKDLLPERYFSPNNETGDEYEPTKDKDVVYAFNLVKDERADDKWAQQKLAQWYTRLVELRLKAKTLEEAQQRSREKLPATTSASDQKAKDRNDKDPSIREQEQLELVVNDGLERETLAFNRKLLQAYFGPRRIRDKDTIYSANVLLADQRIRFHWFLWSFSIFIIAILLVDMNATSWHGYYSRRIAEMWIEEVPGLGRKIPLAQLTTTDGGRPYHLINATSSLVGRRERLDSERRDQFLFSQLFCGSDRAGYIRTERYMDGEYKLQDAVAVSGGAVSPLQTTNPLVQTLLFLFNVRLGQWVGNPSHKPLLPAWVHRWSIRWPITAFRVLIGLPRYAEERAFSFVSDGGHYENLGIAPLLQRRCRLIIALDATADKDYEFEEFTRLARWAKAEHGIRLVEVTNEECIDLSELIPEQSSSRPSTSTDELGNKWTEAIGGKPFSRKHGVIARILYPRDGRPGPSVGYLLLMKSSVTLHEPLPLLSFYQLNRDFPHDSSADQFYAPDRFESYLQLGYHIANACCGQLPEDFTGRSAAYSVEGFLGALLGEPLSSPPQLASTSEAGDAVEANLHALGDVDSGRSRAAVQRLAEILVAEQLSREARRRVADALVAAFEKSGDPLKRLLIAQVLKLRPAYSRRVRAAAVRVSLSTAESPEIRLAALDLLASIGLTSSAARKAVQKLQEDPDAQVAETAREISAATKRAKS